jgi:hypothetical protein
MSSSVSLTHSSSAGTDGQSVHTNAAQYSQTQRLTDRQSGQTDRLTNRQKDRQTERQTDRQTDTRQTDRQQTKPNDYRQIDKQTDRQSGLKTTGRTDTDRHRQTQTDRPTDRQTDRPTVTDRPTEHLPYSLAVYGNRSHGQSVTIGLSPVFISQYVAVSLTHTQCIAPHIHSVCHTASLSSYYTLSVCRSPQFPAALPHMSRSAVSELVEGLNLQTTR